MNHKDDKENPNTKDNYGYAKPESEKYSYAPLKIVLSVIIGLGIDFFS
ncbi:MAG: hypothetical protein Q4P25_04965 [Tissierellia bacterium]|nr:hypothetical protein [Tissierellia bacterium]